MMLRGGRHTVLTVDMYSNVLVPLVVEANHSFCNWI